MVVGEIITNTLPRLIQNEERSTQRLARRIRTKNDDVFRELRRTSQNGGNRATRKTSDNDGDISPAFSRSVDRSRTPLLIASMFAGIIVSVDTCLHHGVFRSRDSTNSDTLAIANSLCPCQRLQELRFTLREEVRFDVVKGGSLRCTSSRDIRR